jgi:hypothetical protein
VTRATKFDPASLEREPAGVIVGLGTVVARAAETAGDEDVFGEAPHPMASAAINVKVTLTRGNGMSSRS